MIQWILSIDRANSGAEIGEIFGDFFSLRNGLVPAQTVLCNPFFVFVLCNFSRVKGRRKSLLLLLGFSVIFFVILPVFSPSAPPLMFSVFRASHVELFLCSREDRRQGGMSHLLFPTFALVRLCQSYECHGDGCATTTCKQSYCKETLRSSCLCEEAICK